MTMMSKRFSKALILILSSFVGLMAQVLLVQASLRYAGLEEMDDDLKWEHQRFLQQDEEDDARRREKECTAEELSKRSGRNEQCFYCRLCLKVQCLESLDASAWKKNGKYCYHLLEGNYNGRATDWLSCLESNGNSRLLVTLDNSNIVKNGGNRDTWGTCARRCDDVCYKNRVQRTDLGGDFCTPSQLSSDSTTYWDKCFPCRQCLKRQCETSWHNTECDSIVKGIRRGSSQEWIECLHHDGGGRRLSLLRNAGSQRELQDETNDTSLWSNCARKCKNRCHHAIRDYSELEFEPLGNELSYGPNGVEPLCRIGEGNESAGTPSLLAKMPHFVEPLNFRVRGDLPYGFTSSQRKISIFPTEHDRSFAELTDRPMLHGETFEVRSSDFDFGVGLCIENCDMKYANQYGTKLYSHCIGIGGMGAFMYFPKLGEYPDSSANWVTVEGQRTNLQKGFTYDAVNNCLTPYVDGASLGSCLPLPSHFEGKVVRAIAEVRSDASVDLVLHQPPATQ